MIKRWGTRQLALAAAVGLVAGGSAVGVMAQTGAGPVGDRRAIETVVRDYLLAHPEILEEMSDRLLARRQSAAVAENRAALTRPFAGAWAGAPDGDVTLVMFSDYACGYCRRSLADIDRLLATDKALKVVWRELPILGQASDAAARVALTAAKTGRYGDAHRAFFTGGGLSPERVAAVARNVGVEPAAANRPADDIDAEIAGNIALARAVGVSATPVFVVGDQVVSGAVGYDALRQAVAAARRG